MIHLLRVAAICGAALCFSAPAFAQNLALRAPQWAQAMLASDVTPTTGGRSLILAPDIPLAVRVTIAPARGGVARVIRYDLRGETGTIALRRFTGHPSTGWWLWGGDTPRVTEVTSAQRTEIDTLARAAAGIAGQLGGETEACPAGERIFIELAVNARAISLSRACAQAADPAGRLALRLSELAGSRTEEELAAAAVSELLEVDRAFAAKAGADGVPAAFAEYAAVDAVVVSSETVSTGHTGIAERYRNWPQGARLEWAPETARVSARGDMGWTWGNSVYIAPDGTRTPGRYISVWTRDYRGEWRYAFDAAVR